MADVFVTGGTGFIGAEAVRALVAAGHTVRALARSTESETQVRALGGQPVAGDLAQPGPWQEVAARAAWVVHLAQPLAFGGRVTRRRAEAYRDGRLTMDRNLLDPLRPGVVERIVYVAGTSYYGNVGTELRDESVTPRPRGWGPYIAPALERLAGDVTRGLPIVTAFPGWVYGDGSWFRDYVLRPLKRGTRLTQLGGESRWASPIHVGDCARALVHLCAHGQPGENYFVVDDRPTQMRELPRLCARTLNVALRTRQVPVWLARLLLGPVVTDSLQSDTVLSNARLKALGFRLEHPTIDEGIPQVLATARPFADKNV